jgi:hypothetical protein
MIHSCIRSNLNGKNWRTVCRKDVLKLLNVCMLSCLSRDLYAVISKLETLTDEKYGGIEIG